MSVIHILLVEDFAPFREFIHSRLRQEPGLQVVGEVADGLEAVQKAEQLKPDLVLLDIGLPTLNGIAAARRIRKVSSESKIIFVSMVSSADAVQEALSTVAAGYIVKMRAGVDLLPAVAAALEGGQFLSNGLPQPNIP